MKDYITIIKAIKKSWREKVDFIKIAHTNNDEQKIREYCTLIQGEAVEFGNMLENDGLQWSNIIKKLEVISEVCYQLVVKQIDINLFVSIMNYTLFLLDYFGGVYQKAVMIFQSWLFLRMRSIYKSG
jgi:hypothetical protein